MQDAKRWIVWIVMLAIMVQGCARNRQASKEKGHSGFSSAADEELAVGGKIHEAILQSFYPYTEPRVVTYVNKIGDSLADQSERRELSYRFTVLYSDKIYATSAPGGFVYVTTGMLYFLENESELAAVLAHEIGELQFRNPQIVTNGRKFLDSAARGGAMVGPAFGPIGMLAAVGLVLISNVSTPQEVLPEDKLIEADKKALHYMLAAEQDPQALIDVFYKILRAKNEVMPYFYDYYQSRPISVARFASLNETFAKLPLQGQSFKTNRAMYQEVTRGIREMYHQN